MPINEPGPPAAGADAPGHDQEGRMVMVSFPMLATVHYELKTRAHQDRTTVKAVVMRALKAFGVEVPEEELTDRRASRTGRTRGQ